MTAVTNRRSGGGRLSSTALFVTLSSLSLMCLSTVVADQRSIVLDMYASWGSPEGLSSWSGDNPCDGTWYGISCGSNKATITDIIVQGLNLGGPLSPSVVGLTGLTSLAYDATNYTAPFPADLITQLTNLASLFAHDNMYSGPCPAQLSVLSSLTSLSIRNNLLTGSLPSQYSTLTNLQLLKNAEFSMDDNAGLCGSTAGFGLTNSLNISATGLRSPCPSTPGDTSQIRRAPTPRPRLCPPPLPLPMPSAVHGYNVAGQRSALLAVLAGWDNDPSLSSWSSADPCDGSWAGISCESGDMATVTEIDVSGSRLNGTLSPDLRNLTGLLSLVLYDNEFYGPIPVSVLSTLTNLQHLLLYGNAYTGTLPPQLSVLTALTNLQVDSNQLTGSIPAALGSLPYLQVLELQYNLLTGTLPPSLGNFSSSGSLKLHDNAGLCGPLTGYSPSLDTTSTGLGSACPAGGSAPGGAGSYPSSPVESGGSSDQMSALLAMHVAWGSNSNLTWTSADPCDQTWTGVTCAEDRVTVTEIDVGGLNLNGTLSPAVARLTGLTVLGLENSNFYGGIPLFITQLTNLEKLYLDANYYSGPVPPQLSVLTKLVELHLESNLLTGTIPAELGALTDLMQLRLDNNLLSGPLPGELANISLRADVFVVDYNAGLCGPTDGFVLQLNLTDTGLQSPCPSVLSGVNTAGPFCENDSFTLSCPNGARLSIQSSYYGRSDNTTCDGRYNASNAVVDDTYCVEGVQSQIAASCDGQHSCTLTSDFSDPCVGILKYAVVSYACTFPSPADYAAEQRAALLAVYAGWGSPSALNWTSPDPCDGSWTGVSCDDNDGATVVQVAVPMLGLNGTLSPAIANLTGLVVLDLSMNNFTGALPMVITQLTNLETLLLYSNNYTGPVPGELSALTSLLVLELDANALTGSIPYSLSLLVNLEALWLDGNALSGFIPHRLSELTALTQLHLESNYLSGSVPAQLSTLTNLKELALNDNNLNGSLPYALADLSYSATLSVDHNAGLCGSTYGFVGSFVEVGTGLEYACPSRYESDSGPVLSMELCLTRCINSHRSSMPAPHLTNSPPHPHLHLPPTAVKIVQRAALLAMYAAWGAPASLSDWYNDNPCDGTWTGVHCGSGDGFTITRIDVGSMNLTGDLSPEAGNLTGLNVLILEANHFTGPFPEALLRLTNLETLSLANNSYSGPLPAQLSATLSLTELRLELNMFTGTIPAEYGALVNLSLASLHDNSLEGSLPPSLAAMSAGGNLTVNGNAGLCGPTWGFADFLDVSSTDLRYACPAVLPDPVTAGPFCENAGFTLSCRNDYVLAVQSADYGRADETTCPGSNAANSAPLNTTTCAGNITAQVAAACDGQHSCTLTSDFAPDPCAGIAKYTVVTYACVFMGYPGERWVSRPPGGRWIGGIDGRVFPGHPSPEETRDGLPGRLTRLHTHSTQRARERCRLPRRVGRSGVALGTSLTCSCCGWGPGPEQPSPPSSGPRCWPCTRPGARPTPLNWTSPDPCDGSWTGIGCDAGDGVTVTTVDVGFYNLTGPLSPAVANLTGLLVLEVSGNNFTGPIPIATLSTLTNLERLLLNSNNYSGSLPAQLSVLGGLTELALDYNSLTGTIPAELGGLAYLATLSLNMNLLSGSLPVSLAVASRKGGLSVEENAGLCGATWGFQDYLITLNTGLRYPCPAQLGGGPRSNRADHHTTTLCHRFAKVDYDSAEVERTHDFLAAWAYRYAPTWANLTGLLVLDLHDNSLDGPLPVAALINEHHGRVDQPNNTPANAPGPAVRRQQRPAARGMRKPGPDGPAIAAPAPSQPAHGKGGNLTVNGNAGLCGPTWGFADFPDVSSTDLRYACPAVSPGEWGRGRPRPRTDPVTAGPFCENAGFTLSCRNDYVLAVQSADYGRADETTCPGSNAANSAPLNTTTCAGNITAQVAAACDGQHSCTLTSDFAPDPCAGIAKYTVVTYACVFMGYPAFAAEQRAPLLAMYAAWGAPDALNWTSPDPCDGTWTGVYCDAGDGVTVTEVYVGGLGCSGTLSPEVASLTGLLVLGIDSSNFTGGFPTVLTTLTNLERLLLYSNMPRWVSRAIAGGRVLNEQHAVTAASQPARLALLSNSGGLSVQNNTALCGSVPAGFNSSSLDCRHAHWLSMTVPRDLRPTRHQPPALGFMSLTMS
ncbi:MAG: hypothetical protein WDW38_007698 [Sanguina aurantia]